VCQYAIVDDKGNKERIVPLGMATRRLLRKYLARRPAIAETEYIFLMSDLSPISINTMKQFFRKLKKRTGIDRIHAHLLRHPYVKHGLKKYKKFFSVLAA
jgi:Site-specific recombinase XerD